LLGHERNVILPAEIAADTNAADDRLDHEYRNREGNTCEQPSKA
jgi:hypothetical protein